MEEQIEVFARGEAMVVRPRGDLRFEDAALLRKQLLALGEMSLEIQFDFAEVGELDPLCLQVLLIFARKNEWGYPPKLKITGLNRELQEFWDKSGLQSAIEAKSKS